MQLAEKLGSSAYDFVPDISQSIPTDVFCHCGLGEPLPTAKYRPGLRRSLPVTARRDPFFLFFISKQGNGGRRRVVGGPMVEGTPKVVCVGGLPTLPNGDDDGDRRANTRQRGFAEGHWLNRHNYVGP